MKHESLDRWLEAAQTRLAAIIEKSGASVCERQQAEEVLHDLSAALEELKVATYQLTLQNEQLLMLREELDAERQRYRELFEFAPCGYLTTNSVGIIGEANAVAANLLGVRPQFLKGKPVGVYIAPMELQPGFHDRLRGLVEAEAVATTNWEANIRSRNGAPIPASITVSVAHDNGGGGVELRWLLRDTTEQKQAQAMIRDIMAEYQVMLENAFDGVLLVKDRIIIRCNHKIEEMLGYDREELIGQSTEILYPSQEAFEKIGKSIYAKLFSGAPYQNEVQVRRKDGADVWCAMAGMMIDQSDPGKGSIWRLQDISQRKETEAILESARSELEVRVRQRTAALSATNLALNSEIAERKRAEEALRESEARLRGLSSHLQSVREEESAKIAREVHDELGGTLTVLKLGLSSVSDKIKDPESMRAKLASLVALTDSAIQSVKRISTSLRPGMLDTLGLVATIKWYVNEFADLTGIGYELHLPRYIRLSVERNTAVFRIIQEALTNVARHAQASKVAIRIWKQKGNLFIEIEDDGRGISEDPLSKPKSYGIFGMHERIHYLGGDLVICKAGNGGALVSLHLPLDQAEYDSKAI